MSNYVICIPHEVLFR